MMGLRVSLVYGTAAEFVRSSRSHPLPTLPVLARLLLPFDWSPEGALTKWLALKGYCNGSGIVSKVAQIMPTHMSQ